MKTKEITEIIGSVVEYQASGQKYKGKIIDKARILGRGEDQGKEFDLYLIMTTKGWIFRVSPAAIIRVLDIREF